MPSIPHITMSTPRKVLSWCLFPITMWYAVGVAFRNFFFTIGLKKTTAPHVTTIGIGNLTCGGTGKTPHTEYLIRLLQQQYRVAYVSRGYRRSSKGFMMCEGEPDAALLGDEAAMVARKFPGIIVAVCEKRVQAVNRLMALPADQAPQVILLDDAYQHRYIKPSCNILLTDYNHPFYKDHILPFGDLREFRDGKDRANIIIVTKVPGSLNPIVRHNILMDLGTQPYQKIFFSSIEFGTPYKALSPRTEQQGDSTILQTTDHFMVVTGVVHPESLTQYLKQYGAVTERCFGDHHVFSILELQQLRKDFDAIAAGNKIIVTTEKDLARLTTQQRDELQGLPLYVMPVSVKMQNSPDFDFDAIILSHVKENNFFLDKLATTKLSF